jgi:DNA gyrase inhibitor GyrI
MSELNVRIVKLEPMRVASVQGFGAGPENQAWAKLHAWAGKKGYMADLKSHRFFGFNNPEPAPGSPNYGYEQWMTVTLEVEPDGDARIKTFHGGLYAVTSCKLGKITETWKKLVLWREGSRYKRGHHQWLEECLAPFTNTGDEEPFDIYLPIVE